MTADSAYDTNPVYQSVHQKFPCADIVISPKKGSVYHIKNAWHRNCNVESIQCFGRQGWQQRHHYGNRNLSECAMGRYKRTLGNRLHAREFNRQKQEVILGCGILNKMRLITLADVRQKF